VTLAKVRLAAVGPSCRLLRRGYPRCLKEGVGSNDRQMPSHPVYASRHSVASTTRSR